MKKRERNSDLEKRMNRQTSSSCKQHATRFEVVSAAFAENRFFKVAPLKQRVSPHFCFPAALSASSSHGFAGGIYGGRASSCRLFVQSEPGRQSLQQRRATEQAPNLGGAPGFGPVASGIRVRLAFFLSTSFEMAVHICSSSFVFEISLKSSLPCVTKERDPRSPAIQRVAQSKTLRPTKFGGPYPGRGVLALIRGRSYVERDRAYDLEASAAYPCEASRGASRRPTSTRQRIS